jgi:hypothetical protein
MPANVAEAELLALLAAQYNLLKGVREKRVQLAAGETLDASVPAPPETDRLILVSRRLPYQASACCYCCTAVQHAVLMTPLRSTLCVHNHVQLQLLTAVLATVVVVFIAICSAGVIKVRSCTQAGVLQQHSAVG